jgi:hypothetical protein
VGSLIVRRNATYVSLGSRGANAGGGEGCPNVDCTIRSPLRPPRAAGGGGRMSGARAAAGDGPRTGTAMPQLESTSGVVRPVSGGINTGTRPRRGRPGFRRPGGIQTGRHSSGHPRRPAGAPRSCSSSPTPAGGIPSTTPAGGRRAQEFVPTTRTRAAFPRPAARPSTPCGGWSPS